MMRNVLFRHLPPWEQLELFPRNSLGETEVFSGSCVRLCRTRAIGSPSPRRFYLSAAG